MQQTAALLRAMHLSSFSYLYALDDREEFKRDRDRDRDRDRTSIGLAFVVSVAAGCLSARTSPQ